MTTRRLVLLAAIVLCMVFALTSCSRTVVHHRHGGPSATVVSSKKGGPPPHAPAHGYRHKHADGVELVYTKSLGVYVVQGYDNCYFYEDRYYRSGGSSWEISVHIGGPWQPVKTSKLPPGLRSTKGHGKKVRG